MNKKTALILCAVVVLMVVGITLFKSTGQKTPLQNPLVQQITSNKPQLSATFKEYTDPSGFTFSYPDNLSLNNNEATDDITYADIQLSSKDVSGSISIKITDSKFKSLDDWLKSQVITQKPKEVKLGNLEALEVQLNDRLLLGTLDQGIFFNIEMPAIEKDFWLPVYNKILSDFSFALPENTSGAASASTADIIFEGEETVE